MNDKRSFFSDGIGLIALVAVLLVAAAGLNSVQAQEKVTSNWRFSWTAPTYGTPPSYYVAQIRRDGTEVQTLTHIGSTTLNIAAEFGHDYEIRVAAVDALERQGPFSGWSERTTNELVTPRL
ncbi:MAG: hypothetical protein GY838_04440 [bacterium]|nr:hypothetical protein [bacterium]